jgi:site-specific DNA-methyltransferase (adenine-specific)
MIYQKANYIPLTHNRCEQSFEFMFVLSKGKPKTFNPIMVPTKGAGDTYNISRKGYCATIKEGAQRRRNEDLTTKSHKISPNIFTYTCGSSKTGHPAPFPEQLAQDQIQMWSNEKDLVYDPFMGSGTTALVANRLGRNFIGSEISEEYCGIANSRLNNDLF